MEIINQQTVYAAALEAKQKDIDNLLAECLESAKKGSDLLYLNGRINPIVADAMMNRGFQIKLEGKKNVKTKILFYTNDL